MTGLGRYCPLRLARRHRLVPRTLLTLPQTAGVDLLRPEPGMNHVVIHLLSGQMIKGSSLDVRPDRPLCHVKTTDGKMIEVKLTEMKALFFVRDLVGDPHRDRRQEPLPDDPRLKGTKRMELRFHDGERMVVLTNSTAVTPRFFFVVPIDADSNNVRILVNRDAIAHMTAPS